MNFLEIFKRMEPLPYVILLHGAKGSRKEEMALSASQYLLQTEEKVHPDLHHFYPEGKSGLHTIQAIRKLCYEITLSSHAAGGYKCFIIYHAERMLPASSNALLKTFEEPPERSIIFLLTTKPSLIIPTIRSRAQSYGLQGKSEKDQELQNRFLEICAHRVPISELALLSEALDEERQQEEQHEVKLLSKEMTGLQREAMIKEIEGRVAMRTLEKRENLFETLFAFYRDLFFYHRGVRQDELFFPHLVESYKVLIPIELEKVEAKLQKVRMAQERGVKLAYCLEECLCYS